MTRIASGNLTPVEAEEGPNYSNGVVQINRFNLFDNPQSPW